jgi:protein-disulfide isomerase
MVESEGQRPGPAETTNERTEPASLAASAIHRTLASVAVVIVTMLVILAPDAWRVVRTKFLVRDLANSGHPIGGGSDVTTKVVVFTDYQCPVCAVADSLTVRLYGHDSTVTFVYHHFPLETLHPFAFEAAVAAECANEQRAFERIHHLFFSRQAAIGHTAWGQWATDAGIRDTARFLGCMDESATAARVEADVRAAARLGLKGTPAFIVGTRIHYGILPDSVVRVATR